MVEGWQGEEYLILFDEMESADISLRYDVNKFVAGYKIVGLRGWDDFIVEKTRGNLFTIPTVPLDLQDLVPLGFLIDRGQLRSDERFRGKIKWYTKPVVFGGDPGASNNMIWVSLEKHIELVKWWNQLYQTMK